MTRVLFASVMTLLLSTTACGGARRPPAAAGDPNLITAAELAPHGSASVRIAIERLRPAFLRTRGRSSIMLPDADRIVVYLDHTRMGGVEVLDQIPSNTVSEIRYLSAPDATSRYGSGHTGGAIVLTSH